MYRGDGMSELNNLIKRFEYKTGLKYEYDYYDDSQPYYNTMRKKYRKDELIEFAIKEIEKLKKYIGHLDDCKWRDGECTCGFDEL